MAREPITFDGCATPFDRFLLKTVPAWGAARIRSRVDHAMRMQIAERTASTFAAAWEASEHDRFRGASWLTSRLSSNDDLTRELETLVDRSLDLYRKDVFAASAINGRVDNVICTGIRPQSRVQPIPGVLTQKQANDFNAAVEKAFAVWAREERFYAKQRMLERSNALYGESLAVYSDDDTPQKPVTLAFQVINPQRLPYETISHDRTVYRLGIKADARNRPLSYLLHRNHPNDAEDNDHQYVTRDADRVAHCYEECFPGQLRGYPWLAPAMTRLKDLKDFAEAHLISEQTAACFSAFVTGVQDPVLLAQSGRVTSDLENLEPGTIQYLGDGEGVEFSNPARPGNTLAPYMQWALHGVAAALRYPYELLVKEYTNNFSGGRLSLIDGRMTFKTWQQMLIETTFQPLWSRFIDQCVFQGVVDVDLLAYEEHRNAFQQHVWLPPGWPWIDPEKEVRADVAAIEAGLLTETESLATRGRDFEETQAVREREQIAKMESQARIEAKRRKLGLVQEPQMPEEETENDTSDEKEPVNADA